MILNKLIMKSTIGQVSEYFSFDFEKIDGFDYSLVKTNEFDILQGNFEIGVLPLSSIPIQNNPLVIAALSERAEPRVIFFIRKKAFTGPGAFGFPKNAQVFSDFPFYLTQLKYIRPDIQVIQNPEEADLIVGNEDVLYLENEFLKFPIHPSEITPMAGSGVWVCLVHKENFELRKKLVPIHQFEVAKLTNVERKISHHLKGIDHGINIYTDQNSFYHMNIAVWTQGNLKRVKLSSSTLLNFERDALKALEISGGN